MQVQITVDGIPDGIYKPLDNLVGSVLNIDVDTLPNTLNANNGGQSASDYKQLEEPMSGNTFAVISGDCYYIINTSTVTSGDGTGGAIFVDCWIEDVGSTVYDKASAHTPYWEDNNQIWFDWDGSNKLFQTTACCVHEDTLIRTNRGILKIQYIRKDDKVLTLNDEFVDVIYNIKYITTNKFVKIEKDAFDTNCPENDLYITGAHPIYLNGTEIEARHLVNGKTITNVELEKSAHVYSLCTKDRYPVLMDGLMVMTWSQVDWEKTSKKSKMIEWRL